MQSRFRPVALLSILCAAGSPVAAATVIENNTFTNAGLNWETLEYRRAATLGFDLIHAIDTKVGNRQALVEAGVLRDCPLSATSAADCQGAVEVIGRAQYSYQVEAKATPAFYSLSGAPTGTDIPVELTWLLQAYVLNGGTARAEIDVHGVDSRSITVQADSPASGNGVSEKYLEATGKWTVQNTASITLTSFVDLSFTNAPRGFSFAVEGIAFSDPTATVDPNWRYASFAEHIEITEFLAPLSSQGTPLAPVPLPSALGLLLAAGGALMGLGRLAGGRAGAGAGA